MHIDVYIFLGFVVIFLEFFSFLRSVLRVSPESDPRRRDRSVSVLVESAAETATLNLAYKLPYTLPLITSSGGKGLGMCCGNLLFHKRKKGGKILL